MTKFCCKGFEEEASGFAGSIVYEEDNKQWWVFTDMEGGRYVFDKPLKYCPFCGAKLEPPPNKQ